MAVTKKKVNVAPFAYLKDNLINKVHTIEVGGSIVVQNFRLFTREIDRLCGDMSFGNWLHQFTDNALYNGMYDFNDYMVKLAPTLGNRILSDLMILTEHRNRSIYHEDNSSHFAIVPNVPRPATIIRNWLRGLIKDVETLVDYAVNHPEEVSVTETSKIRFLHDRLRTMNSILPGTKVSFLDKYLADSVLKSNHTRVKCLINNCWPKYRGMFGDHSSCYYSTHDHARSRIAVMKHGFIARFYDEDVSDEAILANWDNPLGVAKPLDTDFYDWNGSMSDTNGTDGCLGRLLIVPALVSKGYRKAENQIGLINAYRHGSKTPLVGRDILANWLVSTIEETEKTNETLRSSDPIFVNSSRCTLVYRSDELQSPFHELVASMDRDLQKYASHLYDSDDEEVFGDNHDNDDEEHDWVEEEPQPLPFLNNDPTIAENNPNLSSVTPLTNTQFLEITTGGDDQVDVISVDSVTAGDNPTADGNAASVPSGEPATAPTQPPTVEDREYGNWAEAWAAIAIERPRRTINTQEFANWVRNLNLTPSRATIRGWQQENPVENAPVNINPTQRGDLYDTVHSIPVNLDSAASTDIFMHSAQRTAQLPNQSVLLNLGALVVSGSANNPPSLIRSQVAAIRYAIMQTVVDLHRPLRSITDTGFGLGEYTMTAYCRNGNTLLDLHLFSTQFPDQRDITLDYLMMSEMNTNFNLTTASLKKQLTKKAHYYATMFLRLGQEQTVPYRNNRFELLRVYSNTVVRLLNAMYPGNGNEWVGTPQRNAALYGDDQPAHNFRIGRPLLVSDGRRVSTYINLRCMEEMLPTLRANTSVVTDNVNVVTNLFFNAADTARQIITGNLHFLRQDATGNRAQRR